MDYKIARILSLVIDCWELDKQSLWNVYISDNDKTQYQAELIKARKTNIEKAEKEILEYIEWEFKRRQKFGGKECKHSFDVNGVCKLCGLTKADDIFGE